MLPKKISKLFTVNLFIALMFFTSCEEGDGPKLMEQAIVIDCNYFSKNPNAVLTDNPNAPVDYIITCQSTSIPDDVVIEPGVTLAFETDAGLWIREDGALKAVGTSSKPITFTGVDKSKGSWGGIFFASNDTKNEMKYTTVEYAGGANSSSATNNKGGVVIGSGASLKFSDNTIQHCAGFALNLYYSANPAATTIENNTFKNNEIPVQISLPFIGLLKGDNKFMDNTSNKAEITCTYAIATTQTMHKLNIPYLVRGLFNFEIGNEGNLTIEPGTVIEMATDKRIVVRGSLKAAGTSSEKIIFRGETAASGAWGNIVYHSASPNNQLNHVEIRHAGASPVSYHLNRGAVALASDARLGADNIHFEDIFSCMLYQVNPSVLTWGSNITNSNINVAGLENCQN